MQIKVGDKIYSENDQPIMVILTDADKKNIANMLPECTKYASFPDDTKLTEDEQYAWMGAVQE